MNHLFILFFCINLVAFHTNASHEMRFDEIWSLSPPASTEKVFDISVYISEKSEWNKEEIKRRLSQANEAFSTCKVGISKVFVHRWKPYDPLVRVDEFKSEERHYDGIRHASYQSKKVTALQLFYFQDYRESFTTGASVPLAVYPDPKLEEEAFNTAWFPFNSFQKRFTPLDQQYSEEAHELGHIILSMKHDHSGNSNIMANDSKRRIAKFSKEQCQKIEGSEFLSADVSKSFLPLFSTYYHNYSKDFYMSDWCSRNTLNLSQKLDQVYGLENYRAFAVDVVHKNKGKSFYPKKARGGNLGWKFHTFVIVDGYVMDLDFGQEPVIVDVKSYLSEMFGEQLKDLKFQLREPLESNGFRYLDIIESFETPEAKVLEIEEFLDFLEPKDSYSEPQANLWSTHFGN